MNHDTAVQSLAAEKYMLGEMSPAERDDFEVHAADCQQCIEDLSALDLLIENSRAVFEEAAANLVYRD